MSVMSKLLNMLKMEENRSIQQDFQSSKYGGRMLCEQDPNKSITKDGVYDLKNFSQHESDIVKYVVDYVKRYYPEKYQAMGLANEGYNIKYKPRYIIHEIIIQKYQYSKIPYDKFAVFLAYSTKGGYFVRDALQYLENCIDDITPEFMENFISYIPLRTYGIISKLYEHEHEYENAIYYTKLQKLFGDSENRFFDDRISELEKKQINWRPKKAMGMSEKQMDFEKDVTYATKLFLVTGNLPVKEKVVDNRNQAFDSDYYARMCNAYLEHAEEMEQYKDIGEDQREGQK